ncbi:MAG TPA: hypothetical protein VF733_03555 [Candidatus Saccharimonadales bacterium]
MSTIEQSIESGASQPDITATSFVDCSERLWGDPWWGRYAADALQQVGNEIGSGKVVNDELGHHLYAPTVGFYGPTHTGSFIDGRSGSDFQVRHRAYAMLAQSPSPYALRLSGPERPWKIIVGAMVRTALAKFVLDRDLENHNMSEDVGRALDVMTVVSGICIPEDLKPRDWQGSFVDANELLVEARNFGCHTGDIASLSRQIGHHSFRQLVKGAPAPTGEIIVRGARARSWSQIALESLESVREINGIRPIDDFLRQFIEKKQDELKPRLT